MKSILSSRIEDTHAEMEQLALFEDEEDEPREPDVQEVANYVRAMELGLRRVRELPIGSRLIRELHALLLQAVRGGEGNKAPGEFRRSQNWIEYFLRGVRLQAQRALADTRKVLEFYEVNRQRLKEGKRVPQEAARILDQVFANPFISITRYPQRVGESFHNANKGVEFWVKQGLLREHTGQKRNRVSVAQQWLDLMSTPSLPVHADLPPPEKTRAE